MFLVSPSALYPIGSTKISSLQLFKLSFFSFRPSNSNLPGSRIIPLVPSAVTVARIGVVICSRSRLTGRGPWLVLQRMGVVGSGVFLSVTVSSAVWGSPAVEISYSSGSISSACGVTSESNETSSVFSVTMSTYVDLL